jgi:hypothetical protein
MKGRSNGSGVESGKHPPISVKFRSLKKAGLPLLFHPALEVLFGIITKLGQQPSIIAFVSGYIPSSSEKAGVLQPEELARSSQGWSVFRGLSMASYGKFQYQETVYKA